MRDSAIVWNRLANVANGASNGQSVSGRSTENQMFTNRPDTIKKSVTGGTGVNVSVCLHDWATSYLHKDEQPFFAYNDSECRLAVYSGRQQTDSLFAPVRRTGCHFAYREKSIGVLETGLSNPALGHHKNPHKNCEQVDRECRQDCWSKIGRHFC